MVFVSQNIFRKCKYCEKERKKNLSSGRHKGYYRTCGSKKCLRKQYDDSFVCIRKGRLKKKEFGICDVCEKSFIRISPSHKRYCLECVPDKKWRGRAQRYRIGKPQWEELMKKQNGHCALCDRIPEVVDHDHRSGKVRGLLCNFCNTHIKLLDMNNSFIEKAIKYVGGTYSFCF